MKVTDSRRPKLTVLHQIRHAIEGGEKHLAGLIRLGVIDSVALQKFGCGLADLCARLFRNPMQGIERGPDAWFLFGDGVFSRLGFVRACVFLHAENGFSACYCAPKICENQPKRSPLSAGRESPLGAGGRVLKSRTPPFSSAAALQF